MTTSPSGGREARFRKSQDKPVRVHRQPSFRVSHPEPAPSPEPLLADPEPKPSQPATLKLTPAQRDRQNWLVFAKVRALHFERPHAPNITARYQLLKNKLFERYSPTVVAAAQQYARRKLPSYSLLELADLQQEALTRMLTMIDKFDPNFGDLTFEEYIFAKGKSSIRGAILDGLRKLQDCTRLVAQQRRRIYPMLVELSHELGHKPTPEEFCDRYGWEYKNTLNSRVFWSNVYNQKQDQEAPNENGSDWRLSLQDHESKPASQEALVHRVDTSQKILSAIKDPDTNFVVWSYYYAGDSHERIAKSFRRLGQKRSASWVAAKLREGLEILRQKFTAEEFRLLAERHI